MALLKAVKKEALNLPDVKKVREQLKAYGY